MRNFKPLALASLSIILLSSCGGETPVEDKSASEHIEEVAKDTTLLQLMMFRNLNSILL
ncbi:MAG: hypothetical protein IPJ60_11445 [Sphingobacteriaceae bacterium]|nr:hypothetical protein [Sphingobacteriaceae bacterium]